MTPAPLPASARRNVEAVARVEQELHRRRTRVERVGDGVARFFGSLWFIAAHAAVFTVWVGLNVHLVPGVPAFDPYPFLGFAVGIEFIFLTTFVLMNQNLQSRRQEQWGHLTLQVALLTEQEVTRALDLLERIGRELGLEKPPAGQDAGGAAGAAPVTALVAEIEKAREVGEALVEEVGKAREAGQELVGEMEKTREAAGELVGEMQKAREAGADLVEQLDRARGRPRATGRQGPAPSLPPRQGTRPRPAVGATRFRIGQFRSE